MTRNAFRRCVRLVSSTKGGLNNEIGRYAAKTFALGEDFLFGAVSLQKQKGTEPALRLNPSFRQLRLP